MNTNSTCNGETLHLVNDVSNQTPVKAKTIDHTTCIEGENEFLLTLSPDVRSYAKSVLRKGNAQSNKCGLSVFINFCISLIESNPEKYRAEIIPVDTYQKKQYKSFYAQIELLKNIVLQNSIPLSEITDIQEKELNTSYLNL